MTDRIPTVEDILLALTTVGYTDAEAAAGVESIKRRGVAIGHEMARETTQASIGGEFRKAQAIAWAEGFDAGERDVMEHESDGWDRDCIPNPYREESGL